MEFNLIVDFTYVMSFKVVVPSSTNAFEIQLHKKDFGPYTPKEIAVGSS